MLYEIGFSSQFKDEETGEIVPRPFEVVAENFDQRIAEIEAECWATEPSILYLTGKTNFRDEIAVSKGYKANRKKSKPYHHGNIKAYAKANYDVRWQEGLEADDLLAIEQLSREPLTTIICSRDKDLRMIPGMHFGWPCGPQPQYGPRRVEPLGELQLINDKKIVGNGLRFFYSQLITGDTVDNIPGLPKGGPILAFSTLDGLETEEEIFRAVEKAYKKKFPDDYRERILEQGRLLWMVRELDAEGQPVMWELPFDTIPDDIPN